VSNEEEARPGDGKVTIHVRIDERLLQRMVELHISPSHLIKGNLRAEIKRRERKQALRELQQKDPRATEEWLRSQSPRKKRLRGV
jgi:hypothetical protein